jgi:hypothetical protein
MNESRRHSFKCLGRNTSGSHQIRSVCVKRPSEPTATTTTTTNSDNNNINTSNSNINESDGDGDTLTVARRDLPYRRLIPETNGRTLILVAEAVAKEMATPPAVVESATNTMKLINDQNQPPKRQVVSRTGGTLPIQGTLTLGGINNNNNNNNSNNNNNNQPVATTTTAATTTTITTTTTTTINQQRQQQQHQQRQQLR